MLRKNSTPDNYQQAMEKVYEETNKGNVVTLQSNGTGGYDVVSYESDDSV